MALVIRIVDAENKSKNTLNIKQVYGIISQIKTALVDTCGACPIRIEVGKKLEGIKSPVL